MPESIASNTRECFRTFIGQRLVGLIFDAEYPISTFTAKVLVFEDGRGLVLLDNGAHCVIGKEDVTRAIEAQRVKLRAAQADIEEVLRLAGALEQPLVLAAGRRGIAAMEETTYERNDGT